MKFFLGDKYPVNEFKVKFFEFVLKFVRTTCLASRNVYFNYDDVARKQRSGESGCQSSDTNKYVEINLLT